MAPTNTMRHGDDKKLKFQFGIRALMLFVTICSAITGGYVWYHSAARQIPNLILELDDRMGGFIDFGWHGRATSEVQADIRQFGSQATPFLIQSLEAGRLRHADLIIHELEVTKDPRAVQPLVRQLESLDFSVRASAAKAIGNLGDKSAMPGLVECLDDRRQSNFPGEASRSRIEAAVALGKLADPRASEALAKACQDESPEVSKAAANALTRIHGD